MNAGVALNAARLRLGAGNLGDGHGVSLGRRGSGSRGRLLSLGDGANGGVPWDSLGGDMPSRTVGDLRRASSHSVSASREDSAGGPRSTGLGGRLAGGLGRLVSRGDGADGRVGRDCLCGDVTDGAVGDLRRASGHGVHRGGVDDTSGQDDGLRRGRASTVGGVLPDGSGSSDGDDRAAGNRLLGAGSNGLFSASSLNSGAGGNWLLRSSGLNGGAGGNGLLRSGSLDSGASSHGLLRSSRLDGGARSDRLFRSRGLIGTSGISVSSSRHRPLRGGGSNRLLSGGGVDSSAAGNRLFGGGGLISAARVSVTGGGNRLPRSSGGDGLLRGGGGGHRLLRSSSSNRLLSGSSHRLFRGSSSHRFLRGSSSYRLLAGGRFVSAGGVNIRGGGGDGLLRSSGGDGLLRSSGGDGLLRSSGGDGLLRGGGGHRLLAGSRFVSAGGVNIRGGGGGGGDGLLRSGSSNRLFRGGGGHRFLRGGSGHRLLRSSSSNGLFGSSCGDGLFRGGGGSDRLLRSSRSNRLRGGGDRLRGGGDRLRGGGDRLRGSCHWLGGSGDWLSSGGRERLLRATATITEGLHTVLGVGATIEDVRSTVRQLPNTKATPVLLATVLADNLTHLDNRDVSIARRVWASGDGDEDLGVLALVAVVQDLRPGIIVGHSVLRRKVALGVVVVLDIDGIELGLLNQALERKVFVDGRALGGNRNVHVFLVLAELVNHGNVGVVAYKTVSQQVFENKTQLVLVYYLLIFCVFIWSTVYSRSKSKPSTALWKLVPSQGRGPVHFGS